MAQYRQAADGGLEVWTGEGWHYVPRIAVGDVGDMTRPETTTTYQQGDSEMSTRDAGHSGWGISNLNPYSSISGLHPWTQFMLQEGGTQDAFSYLLKSADKEGARINYTRQGDYYVPTSGGGEKWDTNANSAMALLPVALAAAAAAAAAYGASAAGGSAATGSGATAGAGSAGLFESAYGAAGALGGEAGAITAPASAWGATGAGYIPGTAAASGFTPGAGIVAGEMSGAMVAPAVTSSPSLLQTVRNAWNSPTATTIRQGLNVANQLTGGAAPAETVQAPGGAAPAAPAANPANQQVGSINFNKIGAATGGNKPGQVAVPEFDPYKINPAAAGTVGSTFNFQG